jgi:threonine/homoserine/homoserine lactone efflux protein
MPDAPTLLAFAVASLLLLLVPGPAVVYIVTRSATQGRRAGLVSVAGIHAGTVVHVIAAIVGLSAVLVASATAFTFVKLAGAAYLVWLGGRAIRSALVGDHADAGALDPFAPRPFRRLFVDGAVLNVLNPKTAVFFLAFVPQFVDPSTEHPRVSVAVLGGVFILLGLMSDSVYALAGGTIGARLRRSQRARRRAGLIAGGTYLGLGAITAVSGSRST